MNRARNRNVCTREAFQGEGRSFKARVLVEAVDFRFGDDAFAFGGQAEVDPHPARASTSSGRADLPTSGRWVEVWRPESGYGRIL